MTTNQMAQWLNQQGKVTAQWKRQMITLTLRCGKQTYSSTGHTLEDAIEMLFNWVSKLEK